MAYFLKLQNIPMQQFSVTIGDYFYQITVRYVGNGMTMSISVDGTDILDNARCLPNIPIIQQKYLWGFYGSFMFICKEDIYPIYTDFEVTQFLVFLTIEEMQNIRDNQANKNYYATS